MAHSLEANKPAIYSKLEANKPAIYSNNKNIMENGYEENRPTVTQNIMENGHEPFIYQ